MQKLLASLRLTQEKPILDHVRLSSMKPVRLPSTRVGAASGFEVWMIASLFGRNTSCRIVNKHSIEEIKPVVVEIRD